MTEIEEVVAVEETEAVAEKFVVIAEVQTAQLPAVDAFVEEPVAVVGLCVVAVAEKSVVEELLTVAGMPVDEEFVGVVVSVAVVEEFVVEEPVAE